GLTYTFHLRRGVQWHHGYGEFTSEDVVFSLNRVRDPEVGSAWREHLAGVADIEAADRYTVVVRLNAPDPFFPGRVAAGRRAQGVQRDPGNGADEPRVRAGDVRVPGHR